MAEISCHACRKRFDAQPKPKHLVACVDSTDQLAVDGVVQDRKVAMVVADAPYGISIVMDGEVGGGSTYRIPFGGTKNETPAERAARLASVRRPDDTVGGLAERGRPLARRGHFKPVVGDDNTTTARLAAVLCLTMFGSARQVWWGANHFSDVFPASPCWLVWKKNNTASFADAELAWTNSPTAVRIFDHTWNGMLRDSERGERRVVPTQKPVALFSWVYETYLKESGWIFDPFLGSGPSVIAAERAGRRVVGCEIDPATLDLVLARYEKETGVSATNVKD